MKLFLDVDGVLIGSPMPGSDELCLASHAFEFLEFATEHFETHWLTPLCRDDPAPVFRRLLQHTDAGDRQRLLELTSTVQATDFRKLKTEALPQREPFAWIDDAPTGAEIEFLRSRGWLSRWLWVDTREEPDDLLRARRWLAKLTEEGE